MWSAYVETIKSNINPSRLLALDVLRGITITAMILVNNPGSWGHIYAPLQHAKWHGYTPTDLIFPFFIFIVGISIHIVVNRELAIGSSKTALFKHACIRALKLFTLGLFLALFYYNFQQSDFDWWQQQVTQIRIMGVLQRIALVYLLTVLIVMWLSQRSTYLLTAAILLLYWAMLAWVPYSDATGLTYVGELEFGNNFSAFIDHMVLTPAHVYYPEATPFAFDPEGLLSTLPAIATCLFGVFAGKLLTEKRYSTSTKAWYSMIVGIALLALGYIWSLHFPFNKPLWTSSYVLMSAGWAFLSLAILTYIIDIKRYQNWSLPFVVFGANAIFFFMFSGVVARILVMIPVGDSQLKAWLFNHYFAPLFGNLNGSLAFALCFLLVSYGVMHYLYVRKIFFKV
ncbi:acyltransferase family protein [Thalassotalea agarivorans]|uniref:Predicted acyltransferase n=1 Tax=Thalassotalea agarivorans TaxID=349064 RepID=A0A1I0CZ64_THASX|nr:DUF5009 domain-containing protein [Thalassotalea agarivorans]SET24922.1 Predicted acyltransferase [Thalassotalea agarivorans]